MATAQVVSCIVGDEPVRPRQQGIQCEGCFGWNHRVCNTGKFQLLGFVVIFSNFTLSLFIAAGTIE